MRIESFSKNGYTPPSLWIALSIGFFYGIIELTLLLIYQFAIMPSSDWTLMLSGQIPEMNLLISDATISFFIFPILMFAVSSSFHKLVLNDIFIKGRTILSFSAILYVIKYSFAFSIGFRINYILFSFSRALRGTNTSINDILSVLIDVFIFSIALLYLLIFAYILIPRSFNKKNADKNFLFISILSSLIYLINLYYSIRTLHEEPAVIAFFIIFSVITYVYIKIKDKNLSCPGCSNIIEFSNIHLNCSHCSHELYSWAVYSFSNKSKKGEPIG